MILPVISNASPLIALVQIDHIELLEKLFSAVLIPPAVAREISLTVTIPSWIIEQALLQPIGPQILQTSLGSGESEAISLAFEVGAQWIILDDRPARRLAQALGIPVIGTLISGYEDGYAYTALVGSFAPNGYGLYDMAGNVWEWCADWYDSGYYAKSPKQNPTGPSSGTVRVLRGGSWYGHDALSLRVARRHRDGPTRALFNVGFRCVAQDSKITP